MLENSSDAKRDKIDSQQAASEGTSDSLNARAQPAYITQFLLGKNVFLYKKKCVWAALSERSFGGMLENSFDA